MHQAAHSHDGHAHDISGHIKAYVGVFLALVILTAVTVYAAGWKVAIGAHVTIAMIIATVKGSLVASIFMHLLFDKKNTLAIVFVLCAFFFAALMLIPALTSGEVAEFEYYVP